MLQQSSRSPSFAPHYTQPATTTVSVHSSQTQRLPHGNLPSAHTECRCKRAHTHTHTHRHTGPQTHHLHTRTSTLDPTTHRDHHTRDPPHTPNRHNTYTDHHTGPPPHAAPHRPPHTRRTPTPPGDDRHAGPAHTGTDRRKRNHRRRSPQAPPSAPDVARPLQRPPLLARTQPRRGPLRLLRLHNLTPAAQHLLLGFQTSPPARSANGDPRLRGRQSAPAVGQQGRGPSARPPARPGMA